MGVIVLQVIFEEAIVTSICCPREFCIDYFWPIFSKSPLLGQKLIILLKVLREKIMKGPNISKPNY